MTTTTDRATCQRLARLVRERRVELRITKIEAARAAETTVTTYAKVEAGEAVRDVTYSKVDHALGWASGSCRDILNGGEPTLASAAPKWEGSVQGLDEQDLGRVITHAVVTVSDTLTAAEIREITRRVVDDLKRRGALGV
ncbi:hypothetical protein [Streptomyces rimosus]|uniref:hypothetical protein n=1 Tax=Streptomyces rimosus TaxID=1927 RepID=UPI0004C598B4|nr:hypothetical protein [Streptomyces rimosus]